MRISEWKAGDKCYLQFQPGEIVKVEPDGRVTEVSDGCGCLCGRDLRDSVLEVSPLVAEVSDQFKKYYDEIAEMNCGLNMPEIFPWLVEKWVDACNNPDKRPGIGIEVRSFILSLNELLSTNYHGLAVFRRGYPPSLP